MDSKSLSHTTWNCKYHIVFAPKYRRKEIYGKLRKDIGEILRELCNRKEIEIIKKYIQNQLKDDYIADQISMKEYYDPFTGESVKKSK